MEQIKTAEEILTTIFHPSDEHNIDLNTAIALSSDKDNILQAMHQYAAQFKAPAIDTREKKQIIDKINSMVIIDSNCGIDYQTGYNDAITDIIYTLKS